MIETGDDGRSRPERQLLIGADAMEWTLAKRWMAEGKLPALARIAEEGLTAELDSLGHSLPDTVWTTLVYGVNPGKLEKYFYVQYDPERGRLRYARDEELAGKPFWEYLSDAGRRVGVVDVPHVPPREIPGGFLLMNWGAHDNKHRTVAHPSPLLDEVMREFGRHPMEDCERYDRDHRSIRRLRDDVLLGVRRHGELFRRLMGSRPWDVLTCCFGAAHSAGHHFWGYRDPGHPLARERDALDLGDTLERVYRAIDHEIGEMIEAAGPRTRVLVFAPHGMGPLSHASWNLNEMLDLWGFAGGERRLARPRERRGATNPWRILKMVFPAGWQYAIKERLPAGAQEWLLYLWYAGRRRFPGRRAFAVPNNEVAGAIRIAVRGRDLGGTVEPGVEHHDLRARIREALLELTDPFSGRRVVRDVIFPQERFHGPFVDRLPDLTVAWDSSFHWEAVESPRFGVLHIRPQDRRSGSHTASSFLLACGPGIPRGVEIEGGSPLDVAAWVLDAAGVRVPDGFDGRPISPPPARARAAPPSPSGAGPDFDPSTSECRTRP